MLLHRSLLLILINFSYFICLFRWWVLLECFWEKRGWAHPIHNWHQCDRINTHRKLYWTKSPSRGVLYFVFAFTKYISLSFHGTVKKKAGAYCSSCSIVCGIQCIRLLFVSVHERSSVLRANQFSSGIELVSQVHRAHLFTVAHTI